MDTRTITISDDEHDIIEVGSTYISGGGSAAAGVFVLDVTSSGVVGDKTYETQALLTCSTDTSAVRVHVGCNGGVHYTPSVTVNGVAATLTESSTKRWFTGYADIMLEDVGPNTVLVESSTGSSTSVTVTRLEGGPQITEVVFGAYPGTQTALKSGDTIQITIHTEPTATSVSINAGAVASGGPYAVTDGVATGVLTIGVSNGVVNFTASARNAFGTYGDAFVTPTLNLSQTYPVIGSFSVTYPNAHGALDTGESASVSATVTDADTVEYSATGFTVDPGYAATKVVTNTSSGYVASGTNYTVTATRAANGAVSTASTLVKIATVAPTAYITSPTRLLSSPAGTNHEIRIYPSQSLLSAPSLSAQVGVWQGSWINAGGYWSRYLRITDADAKGDALFSGLLLTGLSGLGGSTITSGETYTVGGMSSRTLTFAPFSRVTALGCAVVDQTKTSAAIVGGNTLTRYTSSAVVVNGYYIANSDGSYNPNGAYLGLSDSALAGSNTSGTLQATFSEAA